MRVLYKLPNQKFWRRIWFVKPSMISLKKIAGQWFLAVDKPRRSFMLPLSGLAIGFAGAPRAVASAKDALALPEA